MIILPKQTPTFSSEGGTTARVSRGQLIPLVPDSHAMPTHMPTCRCLRIKL